MRSILEFVAVCTRKHLKMIYQVKAGSLEMPVFNCYPAEAFRDNRLTRGKKRAITLGEGSRNWIFITAESGVPGVTQSRHWQNFLFAAFNGSEGELEEY